MRKIKLFIFLTTLGYILWVGAVVAIIIFFSGCAPSRPLSRPHLSHAGRGNLQHIRLTEPQVTEVRNDSGRVIRYEIRHETGVIIIDSLKNRNLKKYPIL